MLSPSVHTSICGRLSNESTTGLSFERRPVFNLNLRVLTISVSIYKVGRRLSVEGAVAGREISVDVGAVAGSKWAIYCLRLVLLRPMDMHVQSFPVGIRTVYVDDVTALLAAPARAVVATAVAVMIHLLQALSSMPQW